LTTTSSPFRFSTTTEVRWRDLDALNHVNNAVYFTYLEEARIQYVRELGLAPDAPSDMGMILGEASCRFKSPLTLGEQVTVHIRVSELRRSSFIFEYLVEGDDRRVVAQARTAQVCYDYENQRSVPIPDVWRNAIVEFEPGLAPQAMGENRYEEGGP